MTASNFEKNDSIMKIYYIMPYYSVFVDALPPRRAHYPASAACSIIML